MGSDCHSCCPHHAPQYCWKILGTHLELQGFGGGGGLPQGQLRLPLTRNVRLAFLGPITHLLGGLRVSIAHLGVLCRLRRVASDRPPHQADPEPGEGRGGASFNQVNPDDD